jgi:hemerythrin-like domain-containing protein
MTDAAASPRVTRRRVLLGVAGLTGAVVGAGATQAGNELATTTTGAGVGPHLPSPGEELMTEHGVLSRVLLAYRALQTRLAGGDPVPAGVVTDAAQIVADYIEDFHEGLEEAYVFPRVRAAQPALVATLLVQHDRGRHLTQSILATAAGGLDSAKARAGLQADLAAFVRMYEPHEAWEDTVIYPQLRAATTQRVLDELAERFADLENAKYGDAALATMVSRVSGVEEQLGIADLAAFTP